MTSLRRKIDRLDFCAMPLVAGAIDLGTMRKNLSSGRDNL